MKKKSAWKHFIEVFERKLTREGVSFTRRKDFEESGGDRVYIFNGLKGAVQLAFSRGYQVDFDIASSSEPNLWPPQSFFDFGPRDKVRLNKIDKCWSLGLGSLVGAGDSSWQIQTWYDKFDIEAEHQKVVDRMYEMLESHGFKLLQYITDEKEMTLQEFIDENRDERYLPKEDSALEVAQRLHADMREKPSKMLAETYLESAEVIESHAERQRGTPLLPKEDEEEALRLAEEIRAHALKFL